MKEFKFWARSMSQSTELSKSSSMQLAEDLKTPDAQAYGTWHDLETDEKCENTAGIFFTCRSIVSLRMPDDETACRQSCGFHLTRSKWDPYPWVGFVEAGSIADASGLRAGDCLLEINSIDVVGLRVKEIASLIKKDPGATINLHVWRNSEENSSPSSEAGVALSGPLPTLARKLAKALSGAVRALECPICLETATSPVSQCVHGHILCVGCRAKTPRCPVCRVRLGQGRCLLADEVQRNIREAFEDSVLSSITANSVSTPNNCSLREKLFGKIGKKFDNCGVGSKDVAASPTKTRMSFARLLLGFDKAVSADNLSVMNMGESSHASAPSRRVGELSQNDRAKSASTGELSRSKESQNDESLPPLSDGKVYKCSSGYLSVPQTPTWGGSTESMTTNSFPCPLASKTNCTEPCSYDNYMEHLGRSHSCVQTHLWGPSVRIPLPLPFGSESAYIIHHQHELYFFQIEDESAWLLSTANRGEWILHGWSSNGTEIKLRRPVIKISTSKPPLSSQAPIPSALGINLINIELVQLQSEALEV